MRGELFCVQHCHFVNRYDAVYLAGMLPAGAVRDISPPKETRKAAKTGPIDAITKQGAHGTTTAHTCWLRCATIDVKHKQPFDCR